MEDVTRKFYNYCLESKTKIAKKVLKLIDQDRFSIYKNGKQVIIELYPSYTCPNYAYYFFHKNINNI